MVRIVSDTFSAEVLSIPEANYARAGNKDGYRWAGKTYPRITSIVDMFTGGHLPQWFARMSAGECAEIVQQYEEKKLPLQSAHAMILDVNSRSTAAIRYRDEKGAIGTITHDAIDDWHNGVRIGPGEMLDYLATLAERNGLVREEHEHSQEPYSFTIARKARSYVQSSLSWWNEAEIDLQDGAAEAMVVNDEIDAAGTRDVYGISNRKWLRKVLGKDMPEGLQDIERPRLVLDYKTSNQLNLPKVKMQTAGYRYATFVGVPSASGDTGHTFLIPPADACGALHIGPSFGSSTDCKFVLWTDDESSYEALSCLRYAYGVLYDLPKRNHKARTAARANSRRPKEDPI